MFHMHQWKVLSEHKELSPAEKFEGRPFSASTIPLSFFKATLVTLVTCEKCGKIEKFVTAI